MASTESRQTKPGDAPVLGKEGDTCAQCGKSLATDQRYCLNCGHRRGEPRVPFEQYLGGDASENGVARAPATSRQWNPLAAAALIALLGIMLLIGVLIGKDENDEQAPAPAAPAAQSSAPSTAGPTTTAPTPTTATPTTPTIPPATGETGGGAAGAQAPGAQAPAAPGAAEGRP